jgi:hypothetical protein
MWIGKATVFAVGLAVVLAVILGVATAAMAAAPGDPFRLGKSNVVNKVSTLVKRGAGPALSLKVRGGQPPLAVNSGGRVKNLNADRVDGKDSSAFAPADSAPLWAVVRGDGISTRFNGLTGNARTGTGRYTVSFDRDVSRCAYSATIVGQFSGTVFFEEGPNSDSIQVKTTNENGSSADRGFHLIVYC